MSDSLDHILASYLRRIDAGEAVDRDAFLTEHAAHAADLRSFFAHRDAMEQMAGALEGSGRGSSGDMATIAGDSEPKNGSRLPRVRYIGDYELLEEIARGGMGVVYRARQVSLNRTVALKMILSGELASQDAVTRFRQEAEAAAHLDHPNIVPIYEVGSHEGQQYFSMKLIEGGSLAQRFQESKLKEGSEDLPEKEAARILSVVARAVHHAHQRKLLHRDLKPANILLDAAGEPHITDFGLAKRVEGGSDLTHSGAIIGTPSYMAPEQAAGDKTLTTSCDIFSLGAILYESLTGRPPFRGATPMDTVLQLLSSDAVRPSSIRAQVDPDLETIALKCLEKDPALRYDSAAALADDLDRWQRGEPITARPTTAPEQIAKWTRRNPALAGLIGAIALAILAMIGLAVSASYQSQLQSLYDDAVAARGEAEEKKKEADKLRDQAEQSQKKARQSELHTQQIHYAADMSLAAHEFERTKLVRARDLLQRQRPAAAGEVDWRSWEWNYLWRMTHLERQIFPGHEQPVQCVVFSHDGKTIFSGDQDPSNRSAGALRAWNIAKPAASTVLWHDSPRGRSPQVYFTGTVAIAASPKGPILAFGDGEKIRLVPTDTGKPGHILEGHTGSVTRIEFSPDGATLASGSWEEGDLKIWDVATGQLKKSLKGPRIGELRFTPAGQLLAGSYDLQLWDLGLEKSVANFPESPGPMTCLAVSPDGKWVAAGDREGGILIWEFAGRQLKHKLPAHTKWVTDLAFAKDNERLLSSSHDGTICVWKVSDATKLATYKGHEDGVEGLALSPDGKLFASAGKDKSVRLWDFGSDPARSVIGDQPWSLQALGTSAGGKTLVVGDYTGVRLYNSVNLKLIHSIAVQHWLFGMDVSPDGKVLATCGNQGLGGQEPGVVKLWDLPEGKLRATLSPKINSVKLVKFSPDGELVMASSWGFTDQKAGVAVFHVADGKELLHLPEATIGSFRADSRGAAFIRGLGVTLWDLESGKTRSLTASKVNPPVEVAFSPRVSALAVAQKDGAIELWDTVTGAEANTARWSKMPRESIAANSLTFSPDGATLVATTPSNTLLLQAATGDLLSELKFGRTRIAFTPDSRTLITTGGEVQLWQATTGQFMLSLGGYPFDVNTVVASPDGAFIAVGGGWRDENAGVYLWRK